MDLNAAYKSHRAVNWTRIEMLLALYDAAMLRLAEAQSMLAEGQQSAARQKALETVRIVAQLKAGVNSEYGELSENLERLYEYVNVCLLRGDAANLSSASKVLTQLREGFDGIRAEANELENQGEIPPLEDAASHCDRIA